MRHRITLAALLLTTTLAFSQTTHKPMTTTQAPKADMNAVWSDELPNLKSDLAELRAMFNVLASQESNVDLRTAAAIQTNRKMWQVVIARMTELTQRMEAMESRTQVPTGEPKK